MVVQLNRAPLHAFVEDDFILDDVSADEMTVSEIELPALVVRAEAEAKVAHARVGELLSDLGEVENDAGNPDR